MHTEALAALVRLSQYAGMRADLVQAGGGNSSVKLADGDMYIKASGFWLSEVTEKSGWSRLPVLPLVALLDDPHLKGLTEKAAREEWTGKQVQAQVQQGPRSSIETLLHAAIPQRYVLHTHPLLVNMWACLPQWESLFTQYFTGAACVPYHTPGLELTLAMRARQQAVVAQENALPQLYFLQNHGLIVAADTEAEVYTLHDHVLDTLEAQLNLAPYVLAQSKAYRASNALAHACNAVTGNADIAVLATDADVQQLVQEQPQLVQAAPFCPDVFVFCGVQPLVLDSVANTSAIRTFVQTHGHAPKVVVMDNHVYYVGASLRKCHEIADVFGFHLRVLAHVGTQYTALPKAELDYLGNWEAEKYRQQR